MQKPLAMFAMDPALVGHRAGVVLGKKSGTMSVVVKARELGYEVGEDRAAEILKDVKKLGIQKRRLVTDDEFIGMLKAHA